MTTLRRFIWKGLIYYGMFRAGMFALNLTSNVLVKTIRNFQNHKSIYASNNNQSYAVITAGSGGLGFAFATQLAKKGYNICLIARDMNKLEEGAQALRSKYAVNVHCVSFDFARSGDPKAWAELADALKGLDIAILVNNLGGYGWVKFEEHKEEAIQTLLENCIYANTLMTRLIIPRMLKRKEKSAVINVGSFAGEATCPTTAVNCASKMFIHRLTLALAREYENDNIDFLVLIPGLIDTAGLKEWKAGEKILVSSPEDVAEAALEDCKSANQRGNVTNGTWKHALFFWLHMSPWTRRWFIKKSYNLDV